MVIPVSKRAIDAVFEGLFALTDIRAVLRDTAPTHDLDAEQKEKVGALLDRLERAAGTIREDLLK